MILLDTNVISELMRPQPNSNVIDWLDQQDEYQLFICSIVQAEIEYGIAILPDGKRKQALRNTANFLLDSFKDRCLTHDCSSASAYGLVRSMTRSTGHTMTTEDAQIAAIALHNNMTLATRNIEDFSGISELLLINPWEC